MTLSKRFNLLMSHVSIRKMGLGILPLQDLWKNEITRGSTGYIVVITVANVAAGIRVCVCDPETLAGFGERIETIANRTIVLQEKAAGDSACSLGGFGVCTMGSPSVALDPTMNQVLARLLGTRKAAGWS